MGNNLSSDSGVANDRWSEIQDKLQNVTEDAITTAMESTLTAVKSGAAAHEAIKGSVQSFKQALSADADRIAALADKYEELDRVLTAKLASIS